MNGITTTTTVDVSWYVLGQHLAHLSNLEQCAFLDGFASGIHSLDAVDSYAQIEYITGGVHGHTEWLVEELTASFAEKAAK